MGIRLVHPMVWRSAVWFWSHHSGVGNAAAAAALATAPFRPKWCGKASSEPYISAAVGKGSTTPVIE